MLGLNQIVLHNTFITGKTVRLPCAGHTNTSGDNGAGKTSALNLIPIFYGKEPDRLIQRAADKLSFLDFYLPQPSSLIAFEYLREDGPRCAVMYRHSAGTNKLVYRFISASFSDSFFLEPVREKLLQGTAVSEVISELKLFGVECSKQVDIITDYRAIIQNNKLLLTKGGRNTAAFRRMAQQYCLGHGQARMSHLDEMATALLKRSEMFGKFKAMIAATMFQEIYVREKPEFRDKAIVDNIRSLNEFRAHEPHILECVSIHRERLSTRKLMNSSAAELTLRVEGERKVLEEQKDQQMQSRARLSAVQNEYEDATSGLRSDLKTACREYERLDIELNDIYAKRDDWDNQDIVNKRHLFEKLPTLREQHSQAKDIWEKLVGKHSSLENEWVQTQARMERQFTKDIKRVMDEESATQYKRAEANTRYENKQGAIRQAVQEEHDVYAKGPDSDRLEALKQQYWVTATESENVPRTPEETEQAQCAEQAVEDADIGLVEAEKAGQSVSQALVAEESLHQQAVDREEAARKELEDIEEQYAELRAQVAPDDKTLLAAFRREDPIWADSIGRVIQPELLQRKDLNPTFETSNDSIFGWLIDLSKIDIPSFAHSETVLNAKLDKVKLEVRNARADKEEAEKNAASAFLRLKAAREVAADQQVRIKQAKQHQLEARAGLSQIRNRIIAAQEERAVALKAKLNNIESERDALASQIESNLHAIKKRGEQQLQELCGSHAIIISELDTKLGVLKQEKTDLECSLVAEKKRIKQVFDEKYRAEGVDPEKIQAARMDCERRTNEIRVVESYGSDIDRYDDWLRRDWSRVDALNQSLADALRAKSNAEQQIERLELAYKCRKSELEGLIKQAMSRICELRATIDAAEQLLSRLDIALPITAAVTDSGSSTDLLVEKLSNLEIEESKLSKQVEEHVRTLTRLIERFSDSRIFNAWEQLVAIRKQHSRYDEFSKNFRLEQPEDLQILLEDQIPQIEEILIEDVRAVGNSIHEYFKTLKLLNTQVVRVTNDLKRKINTNQRISSFSDITVRITSCVEGDDYWQPLVAFNVEWTKWLAEVERGLPSDSLIDTLKVASDSLQEAKISQDVNSLIDMEISMVENERHIRIRNDRDFNDSSSNGLSFLAICVVFIGMSRYLCPDRSIQITWPIDELAVLSPNNVARLFAMMKEENIAMFSAFPSADPNMLRHFENRLALDRNHGIQLYRSAPEENISDDDPLLAMLATKEQSAPTATEEKVSHE